MAPNAVTLAVILSVFLLADARLDPSAASVAVRAPHDDASAKEETSVSVDLRPIRASLPLVAIAGDRDLIAHSLRLPHLHRRSSRPLRVPPVELPYGHDMIQSSKAEEPKKKPRKMKIKRDRDEDSDSDSDDEDKDEIEAKRMKKRLKRVMSLKLNKMRRQRQNQGFVNWISRFFTRS